MHSLRARKAVALLAMALLAACGQAPNQAGSPSGTLCFDYFQRCVYPLALDAPLPVDRDNDGVFDETRSCSDGACHAQAGVTGGALRLAPGATTVAVSPDSRGTAMHQNFVSARGRVDPANPRQSALLKKPLQEITHSGGRVFVNDQDAAAREILHWSGFTVTGGDEFSASCASLFRAGGACLTSP